jgi:hypothetical protein
MLVTLAIHNETFCARFSSIWLFRQAAKTPPSAFALGGVFFAVKRLSRFTAFSFFLEGCTPEHTALELNGHPVGANSRFQQQFRRFPI